MFVALGLTGLCAGIALQAAGVLPEFGLFVMAGGVFALCLRSHRLVTLLGLILVSTGAGVVTSALHSGSRPSLENLARRVPFCSLRAGVVEEVGTLGTLLGIDALKCANTDLVTAGMVAVADQDLEPGSHVETRGWLLPFDDGPYDVARGRAGAGAKWHVQQLDVLSPPRGLHALAAGFRRALEEGLGALEMPESGLGLGLTIGDTTRLKHSTIGHFRNAGLSHLLAVSGSNVALVLAAVGLLLRRLSVATRLCACIGVLALYVLVVGPDPSVLRAATSAVVVIIAFAGGTKAHPLNALGLALLVLLTFRPQLLFAAGLHLSVAATLGILVWTGGLADRMPLLPPGIRLGAAATLAAQTGVAPVLIWTFGNVSLAGPAANLLALPAVPPATVCGLLSGALALVDPGLGRLGAWVAAPFLKWILWVGETFGSLQWSSPSIPRVWGAAVALALAPSAIAGVKRCTQMNARSGSR